MWRCGPQPGAPAAVAEAAARALVTALADVDEPLESFDYERSGSYKETIRQAGGQYGTAVLLCFHSLAI
eukprot:SAG22_NODE_4813_length_1158_cov_1.057602_2_plen_69_part_00